MSINLLCIIVTVSDKCPCSLIETDPSDAYPCSLAVAYPALGLQLIIIYAGPQHRKCIESLNV